MRLMAGIVRKTRRCLETPGPQRHKGATAQSRKGAEPHLASRGRNYGAFVRAVGWTGLQISLIIRFYGLFVLCIFVCLKIIHRFQQGKSIQNRLK